MKKYTFAILGDNRTGTTSMWQYLGFHRQISPGRVKEILHRIPPEAEDLEPYINDNFGTIDDTKVLLDGSPNIISFRPGFIDLLKKVEMIDRVCCMYAVRPPIERMNSYNHILVRNHYKRRDPLPYYINDDLSIDHYALRYMFLTECLSYRKLILLEKKLGPENLFVFNLADLSNIVDELLSFLKVEHKPIKIKKINRTLDMSPVSLDHVRILANLKKWIEDNQDFIDSKSARDREKINGRYGEIL